MSTDAKSEPREDASQLVAIGKTATQARIVSAAANLFLSQGYRETTVQEVADEAGMSRATVFWHFGDKPALFRAALEVLLEPLRASLESDMGGEELASRIDETERFALDRRQEIIALIGWALGSDALRSHTIAELLKLYRRFSSDFGEALAGEEHPQHRRSFGYGVALAVCGHILISTIDESATGRAERMAAINALVEAVEQLNGPRTD